MNKPDHGARRVPLPDLALPLTILAATAAGAVPILTTGLLLGFRHGFDWDHLAAITDITSTTAAADAASEAHDAAHRARPHDHGHGGPEELTVHVAAGVTGADAAVATLPRPEAPALSRARVLVEQRHAIALGTLYALGHAAVVLVLGLLALAFGALLPDWIDPLMGRVVGFTLVFLGVWVFVSIYRYARHGEAFRLRSRWMLVFDGIRYGWRRLQARLHGHEHVAPLEMSSYGPRTAFGVGMIHGIGAETGTQALLIATVGGAAGAGLGVPMLVAFIVGLVAANTVVVVASATGFIAGRLRTPIYLVLGALAGAFSLYVGLLFLFGQEGMLPDLEGALRFIGPSDQ